MPLLERTSLKTKDVILIPPLTQGLKKPRVHLLFLLLEGVYAVKCFLSNKPLSGDLSWKNTGGRPFKTQLPEEADNLLTGLEFLNSRR